MDKREVHIFPPSLRPSSLCSLVFTFNSLTSSPCSLLSHLLHSPVFFLYPNRNCSRQKGKKRRSLIVYYYRQHKHTQRRREKHSKEMLSLHTSSSPTLPFHHSTFQPKACVHAVSSSFLSHRNVKSLWASFGHSSFSSITAKAASVEANASTVSLHTAESDVLKALSQIIDPDFGTDIVSCGFVKDLLVNEAVGEVSFRLELTTPACPIKDMFEQKANEVVAALPWVRKVNVTMSAQPAKPMFAGALPMGLQTISNIIAVSSCKGGVGKSTVAVNLAFTLAGMGARVGLFDADVYGPSLPTMVSPENRLLEMNPEKKTIIPTDYLGVKLVSFGFAGQGRAIMRGPMVSGVINQLLTTTEWGELDYLVVDMPPGTGDIQLTLCQVVPLTAAVIVTTPQKLAFIDVAKGVRMFSKLKVPCIAVVENMCHFDADGKRYYPFGRGSGSQVVQQFGIPHLFDLPIRPSLSASGDSGVPEVVADPQGEIASTFQDLGVCVVQQCAKIRQQVSTAVTYDRTIKVIKVKVPASDEEFYLHPATVRRNDQSAQSVIAPYDQLQEMERLVDVPQLTPA
ncbi:fe-S cluster assembly factor HCF101, chloroplastic-like isoform X3 [Coffea arabica]|uniref:Fe-S cluster assembly factor HCF101, chloroplastic-like isoform X3 n=1 Tax=Coffea arabica TaxID=13443 RepID=A0ABM4UNA1_COFAR